MAETVTIDTATVTNVVRRLAESKVLNLDVPVSEVLKAVETTGRIHGTSLGWGVIFGSGYVLIYGDDDVAQEGD